MDRLMFYIIQKYFSLTNVGCGKRLVGQWVNNDMCFFNEVFYPILESIKEKGLLEEFSNQLTKTEREYLQKLPEELISTKMLDVFILQKDCENNTLEFVCDERVIRLYKHPVFYELVNFFSIDKTFSIEKENHNFGYHFHLYEKAQRTKTLLTFDMDEVPNKKTDLNYTVFSHSLYYERHSEGSAKMNYHDLNQKGEKFKTHLYEQCKEIVLNRIEKINFKKQSLSKSVKLNVEK